MQTVSIVLALLVGAGLVVQVLAVHRVRTADHGHRTELAHAAETRARAADRDQKYDARFQPRPRRRLSRMARRPQVTT